MTQVGCMMSHMRRITLPCVCTRILLQLAYSHCWGCLFLQINFPTPWTFGKILRTPLHSEGFPFLFLMSEVFHRRLWNFCQIFWPFPRKLDRLSHSIPLGFSALVVGLPIVRPIVWWRFRGLLIVTLFPVLLGGLWISRKDWFALVSGVLLSLPPAFCSCCPLINKFLAFCFPSLLRYFLCSRISSCSMRRRG